MSIAEQYHIHWLMWPRFIVTKDWFIGRSCGPFKNPGIFGNIIGMLLPFVSNAGHIGGLIAGFAVCFCFLDRGRDAIDRVGRVTQAA